jgi:hypothetical protein
MADGDLIEELDTIIEETNCRSVSRLGSLAPSDKPANSQRKRPPHESQLILKELGFLIDLLREEFQGRTVEQEEPEFLCLLVCLEMLLHHGLKESFSWFRKNEVWGYLKQPFQEREIYFGDNKIRSFLLHSIYLKKIQSDYRWIILNCR